MSGPGPTRTDPAAALGTASMNAADTVREVYGPDARVGTVVIVFDVVAENRDGEYINPIRYWSNDRRPWVTNALLGEAAAQAECDNDERLSEAEKFEHDDDDAD